MATFQSIRGRLEAVTRDALQAAGITAVTFDNVEESPEELPSASISLSFTGTISHSLGCDADLIQGSIIVTIATPKQQGSVAGENAAQQVLQAWSRLNIDFAEPVRLRTWNITGPVTIVSAAPRHIHTLNAAFSGRA